MAAIVEFNSLPLIANFILLHIMKCYVKQMTVESS